MSDGSPVDPPTRSGVPLKDRPVGSESAPAPPSPRRKHCYVARAGGDLEGLVLQWAQDTRGWVALVVYVEPREGGDVTIQEWLPGGQLRPA